MGKVMAACFSVSIDGYGAGPDQSLDHPLGRDGDQLHRWVFPTRTFRRIHGLGEGGTAGIDDHYAARGMENIGAWIIGRNMFGPVRGPWPDESWKGWWGDSPPYHAPVFVLTHHARPPLEMAGGTIFHFVADRIAVLERARAAAGERDVRIGGGVATLRDYLKARLVDELHLAVAPFVLGGGEALYAGLDLPALGYEVGHHDFGEGALHAILTRHD